MIMENDILISPEQVAQTQQRFIVKVYGWMAFALAITGFVAMFTASTPEILQIVVGNKIVFYGLMIAEFLLVVSLVGMLNKMSSTTALAAFIFYSILIGLT